MQRMAARDAKNGFGRMIDLARAGPVAIEKHGRAVVVVVALEEYERLIAEVGKVEAPTKIESHSPKGEQ
jgi:prevent-host-death family protein